jgi:hypothetical protein
MKGRVVISRWQGGESLAVREVANEENNRLTVHAEKMRRLSVPWFGSGISVEADAQVGKMEGDPEGSRRREIFPMPQNDDGDGRRLE